MNDYKVALAKANALLAINTARTEAIEQVRAALKASLADDPAQLRHPDPSRSRWFAQGFASVEAEGFVVVVLRNGVERGIHFLDDYFSPDDRKQIYKLVGTAGDDFRNDLAYLFLLRESIEGLILSGPWSKEMYKAKTKPAKFYLPVVLKGGGVMDDEADDRYRGRKVRACIERLALHFPDARYRHWLTAFQHITDNGDGVALQRHPGAPLDPDHVKAVVEGWFAVKGKKSREDYIKGINISDKTLTRYMARYQHLWPDEWRKFQNLGRTTQS